MSECVCVVCRVGSVRLSMGCAPEVRSEAQPAVLDWVEVKVVRGGVTQVRHHRPGHEDEADAAKDHLEAVGGAVNLLAPPPLRCSPLPVHHLSTSPFLLPALSNVPSLSLSDPTGAAAKVGVGGHSSRLRGEMHTPRDTPNGLRQIPSLVICDLRGRANGGRLTAAIKYHVEEASWYLMHATVHATICGTRGRAAIPEVVAERLGRGRVAPAGVVELLVVRALVLVQHPAEPKRDEQHRAQRPGVDRSYGGTAMDLALPTHPLAV